MHVCHVGLEKENQDKGTATKRNEDVLQVSRPRKEGKINERQSRRGQRINGT